MRYEVDLSVKSAISPGQTCFQASRSGILRVVLGPGEVVSLFGILQTNSE
jgi:hypothetical protein